VKKQLTVQRLLILKSPPPRAVYALFHCDLSSRRDRNRLWFEDRPAVDPQERRAVAIVKEDTEIAKVTEPGAVFGELSILLDQPNKVDVRALETSQFHVADAAVLLTQSPIAAYVAMVLARQLDNAIDLQINRTLRWIS
jgi:hypothetical protein